MKLYMHPVSTTSRPVIHFIADNKLPVEMQVVDLFTGEHMRAPFNEMNPNQMIPVLEDGDFHLTESSAILKYLAEKAGLPAYPKDLKRRARVNETMDWFNANFYRDYGYGLIYPQIFPSHKRSSDVAHEAVIAWGRDKTKGWLKTLNDHMIGPKQSHLCGEEITIADYFGAAIIQVGEVIRCDFASYANIKRWLDGMKSLPSYGKVYEVVHGFAQSVKDKPFVAI